MSETQKHTKPNVPNLSGKREQKELASSAERKTNVGRNVPNLRFPEFSGEWEKVRNEALFMVSKEKNRNGKYTSVLSASQSEGMVERSSLGIDIKYEEDSVLGYKVVHPGDYVIHLRSFQGGFAFSEKTGICSPAYTILQPSSSLYYGFLKDYFTSTKFIDSLKLVTYGIRDGKSISVKEWLKLFTCIPQSLEEQRKIHVFLSLLDQRIAIQNRVIERYESLIKAIIRRAFVTEKAVMYMKLGDIAPNIASGKSKADAGTITLYGSTGIIGTCSKAQYSGELILVARVGSIGHIQMIESKGCGISDNTIIINAGPLNKYVYYFLKSFDFTKITSGTTQPLITGSSIKKIDIPILTEEHSQTLVQLLTSIDDYIVVEKAALNKQLDIKKLLLAKMFI